MSKFTIESNDRYAPVSGNVPENMIDLYVEFIKEVSTNLPGDIVEAIRQRREAEEAGSQAQRALDIILENIDLAYDKKTPICQDTGTVVFHIEYPAGTSTLQLKKDLTTAVVEATKRGYLRPNSVDPITGENPGDNTGNGLPVFFFDETESDALKIQIMLKGGGCENVGGQYSLPHTGLDAGRDVKGVKKVILDAVVQAQGKGCAPGILGVGIGGDRVTGALLAKDQLFRPLQDKNSDPVLADIEKDLLEKSNSLGVGPMGFGGKTTLLGLKAAKMHRIPASYYVSISYMCWATRRKTMKIKNGSFTIQ